MPRRSSSCLMPLLFLVAICLLPSQQPVVDSFTSAAVILRVPTTKVRKRTALPSLKDDNQETAITTTTTTAIQNSEQILDVASSTKKENNNGNGKKLPFFSNWPEWFQNSLRDSGSVRFLINAATRTIAAPIFYRENPRLFPEFVRISGNEYPWLVLFFKWANILNDDRPDVNFAKIKYGTHRSQVAQVMITKESERMEAETGRAAPLFLFFHGGAWGSGFPTMYRLLSLPFLERNFRTVILGYRTFPDANAEEQLEDLVRAVETFTERYNNNRHRSSDGNDVIDKSITATKKGGPVVLMGHSSGAHICLLAAVTGRLPTCVVDALIGASGVYDIERQLKHERKLGVSKMSPMTPANGSTMENFRKFSPVKQFSLQNQQPIPHSLMKRTTATKMPPLLLVHGADDEVAPPKNSIDFFRILNRENNGNYQLEIVDGVGHNDVVLDTCLGGKTQGVICDWIESTVGLG